MHDIPEAGLRQIAKELLQNTSLEILKLLNLQYKTFIEAEIKSLNRSNIMMHRTVRLSGDTDHYNISEEICQ